MQLLNWLYVQDERASLHLDHDALRVRRADADPLTMPLLSLEGIVCFGAISVSTPLIQRCASDGRPIVLLSRTGRFEARVEGPCSGNVLLRRAQHAAALDPIATREIARMLVAGKVQASRAVLMRAAREAKRPASAETLGAAGERLGQMLFLIRSAGATDQLRGYEGEAAAAYFAVFGEMVRGVGDAFSFDRRQRRPPRDRMNAVLSFLYTLLRAEVVAALETTGLDPQVGYLHVLRPGRPALALDLMEELRAPLADRLALNLVNLRQLQADDFVIEPGGAVSLTQHGREVVLAAHRARKREEVHHPVLNMRLPWGLVAHAQARILARHLRGDMDAYVPFVTR
jgi:CRISPR-associated protein Cas1